jgi:hypothetical protein
MRAKIGVMAIAGFFGLFMPAEAQTRFDGTYQLSYSSRVNDTFISRNGVMGSCQERRPGPLTVANGMVRYTTETGRNLAGRVRPNGDFEFGFVAPDGSGSLRVGGIIGGNGTVRVRQLGNSCSYDFVWQKQS